MRCSFLGRTIFFFVLIISLGCQKQQPSKFRPQKVIIAIEVRHREGFGGDQTFPTKNAFVSLLNLDGSLVNPSNFYKGFTDSKGEIRFESDTDIFLPANRYMARVENIPDPTDSLFTVPQTPNRGDEYYIEKTIIHQASFWNNIVETN